MVLKHTMECWRVRKIHASGAATLASGPGSFREKQKEHRRDAHARVPKKKPPRLVSPLILVSKRTVGSQGVLKNINDENKFDRGAKHFPKGLSTRECGTAM